MKSDFSLTKKDKITEFKDTKEAVDWQGDSSISQKYLQHQTLSMYHLTFPENKKNNLQAAVNIKIMRKPLKNQVAELVTHSIQTMCVL